jgi:hypothetical protein
LIFEVLLGTRGWLTISFVKCIIAILMEDQGSVFHAPTSANVTVMRKRPREYLTESEIERLMAAARDNRHGHRDATAILVAYRHALRSRVVMGQSYNFMTCEIKKTSMFVSSDARQFFRSGESTCSCVFALLGTPGCPVP